MITMKPKETTEVVASVYCPICTHTVNAVVVGERKNFKVKPGQKCARCHSSIDAGYIFYPVKAA